MLRMLQGLLGRVEAGRLGRGLAGLRAGWQFGCVYRAGDGVRGTVSYSGARGRKLYLVEIRYTGRGARGECSCPDWQVRRQPCMHMAFVAAHELGYSAQCRSQHRPVQQVGVVTVAAAGQGA